MWHLTILISTGFNVKASSFWSPIALNQRYRYCSQLQVLFPVFEKSSSTYYQVLTPACCFWKNEHAIWHSNNSQLSTEGYKMCPICQNCSKRHHFLDTTKRQTQSVLSFWHPAQSSMRGGYLASPSSMLVPQLGSLHFSTTLWSVSA